MIHEDVVVGFNATAVGGVSVGPRSNIAAGAVVTRDVPSGHVVTETNHLTPSRAESEKVAVSAMTVTGYREAVVLTLIGLLGQPTEIKQIEPT